MSPGLDAVRASVEAAAREPSNGVVLINGADLKPESIRWLWRGWLALGKLHILAGAPGEGKTTIAMKMAATVTAGGHWPDGTQCEPGNVLIWSGEDDPADTLLPRLLAAGADRTRCNFVSGMRIKGEVQSFDPARDMGALEEQARAIGGVKLLIVDPVVSAVRGDSHKNTEVRRALQPVVDLASRIDAAAVGISHFSKGGAGADPASWWSGRLPSRRWPVSCWWPQRQGAKTAKSAAFWPVASPTSARTGGFEYSVEQIEPLPGIFASCVAWGPSVTGTARELLAEPGEQRGRASAKGAAEDFLRERLTAPMPFNALRHEAEEAGHAWGTVRRAADSLKVVRRKGGLKEGWYWQLPEDAQNPPKAPIQNDEHLRRKLSTFDESRHATDDGAVPIDDGSEEVL